MRSQGKPDHVHMRIALSPHQKVKNIASPNWRLRHHNPSLQSGRQTERAAQCAQRSVALEPLTFFLLHKQREPTKGSTRKEPKGITGMEIAKSISDGLARMALAAKVNGEVWDLSRSIDTDAELSILTWRDDEGKMAFWHSSAHLMAEALEAEFPGVKFGIGPPIENGFYYDIDLGDTVLSDADFDRIEKKMLELAKQGNVYERKEVTKDDAIAYFKEKGDEYKLELLEDLEDGSITFYNQGGFTDLCRGPQIPDTSPIKAIKLLNVAKRL